MIANQPKLYLTIELLNILYYLLLASGKQSTNVIMERKTNRYFALLTLFSREVW